MKSKKVCFCLGLVGLLMTFGCQNKGTSTTIGTKEEKKLVEKKEQDTVLLKSIYTPNEVHDIDKKDFITFLNTFDGVDSHDFASATLAEKLIKKENIIFACKKLLPISNNPNVLLAQCYTVDTVTLVMRRYLLTYDKNSGKQLDGFSIVETDKGADGQLYNFSYYRGFNLKDSIYVYAIKPEVAYGMATIANALRLDVWCVQDNGKFKLAGSTNLKH